MPFGRGLSRYFRDSREAIDVPRVAQQAAQFGEHRPGEDRLEDSAAEVQGQERQRAVVGTMPRDEPGVLRRNPS